MMPVAGRFRLGLLLIPLALSSAASAKARFALPPGLQQTAILCLAEAQRLCPTVLTAKDHGVACILGKRRLLSETCRTVYDQGLSFLNGGDVHLDLRALKAHPPRPAAKDRSGTSTPNP